MYVAPQIAIDEHLPLQGPGCVADLTRTLVDQGARQLVVRDPMQRMLRQRSGAGDSMLLSLIAAAGSVPVVLDAGLSHGDMIDRVARMPFAAVVLDAQALFDPMLLRWALDVLGERTMVELRSDGDYLYDPPESGYALELVEAARQLRFQGVRRVLLRDVTGTELPLPRLQAIADVGLDVTFQGMVRNLDDLRDIAAMTSPHVHAVIVGDALYDGRIRLAEANHITDVARRAS